MTDGGRAVRSVRQRLLAGFGANAFGQLVNIGVQLSLVPVLASRWGLETYGLWLLIVTIPTYLLVSDLGFTKAAAAVDMTMRAAADDREGTLRTFQTTIVMMIGVTAVILAIGSLALLLLPLDAFGTTADVTPSDVRLTIAIMTIYGMFILAGTIFEGAYQSTGRYAQLMVLIAMSWLVEGLVALTLALLGYDMVVVATGYVVCRIAAFCFLRWYLWHAERWLAIGVRHANRPDFHRLVRASAAMMAIPLANACLLQGTALAVGFAAGSAAVPAFTTTRTLSRLGVQITNIVNRTSIPEFTVAGVRGESGLQNRIIVMILITAFAVLVPAAVALGIGGPFLVVLWTRGVVEVSVAMCIIMALVTVFHGFWNGLSSIIVASNRQALFTLWFLALALASIPIAYLVAARVGSIGGAVAMLIVDGLMLMLVVNLILRHYATPAALRAALREIVQRARNLTYTTLRRFR